MNLRPTPLGTTFGNLLLRASKPSGALERLTLGATGNLAKHQISIWKMRLPDTAYTAPVGAFWFVSTGRGR